MKKAVLRGLIDAAGLPPGLKLYLLGMLERKAVCSLRAPLKKDPAGFLSALGGLLAGGSLALACAEEEVLFATGFDAKNLAPDRLEAALAEILAALFLAGEGFEDLELIKPNRGRTADIAAARAGFAYAFEVRCLKGGGGRLDAGLLGGKYDRKFPQARNAVKKYGFDKAAVVFVREPCCFKSFVREPELTELAREVYEGKKSPRAAHVCVLDRGRCGVYPPWP